MPHLELRKGPGIIPFWKSIGGYLGAVKWKGRWWYTGNKAEELERALDWIKGQGLEVTRVNGVPRTVERAWEKSGCTVAALVAAMPNFAEVMGKVGGVCPSCNGLGYHQPGTFSQDQEAAMPCGEFNKEGD